MGVGVKYMEQMLKSNQTLTLLYMTSSFVSIQKNSEIFKDNSVNAEAVQCMANGLKVNTTLTCLSFPGLLFLL
jgi:hypothetical protein